MTLRPFRPYPLTSGGHRQTLLGYWLRRLMQWTRPSEDLVVDASDGAKLLLRASWQAGPREASPALVLIHGLGGGDGSGYALCTAELAYRLGWHVLRMNLRGAGDSVHLCPRLYHAGLEGDLVAALQAAAQHGVPIVQVGLHVGPEQVGARDLVDLVERAALGVRPLEHARRAAQRHHGQANPFAGDGGADVDARHVIGRADPGAQITLLLQRQNFAHIGDNAGEHDRSPLPHG